MRTKIIPEIGLANINWKSIPYAKRIWKCLGDGLVFLLKDARKLGPVGDSLILIDRAFHLKAFFLSRRTAAVMGKTFEKMDFSFYLFGQTF